MSVETGSAWPEQEAILQWWEAHRLELMQAASRFRIEGDKRNAAEWDELRGALAQAALLLDEWLKTPFYETREEWQVWVERFRPRVEAAIDEVRGLCLPAHDEVKP